MPRISGTLRPLTWLRVSNNLSVAYPVMAYSKNIRHLSIPFFREHRVRLLAGLAFFLAMVFGPSPTLLSDMKEKAMISLPEPTRDGRISLEAALQDRRSVRFYSEEPLTLGEVSQLLWAGQGITRGGKFRTAPSAGALYPLEIYLVAGRVESLEPGIYRYLPLAHELESVAGGDRRDELARASLNQGAISQAAINFVITGVYQRTAAKYGERALRYIHMESGHVAQNISLQATSFGLGTVVIGAFVDDAVQRVLMLEKNTLPLSIMPVGRRR